MSCYLVHFTVLVNAFVIKRLFICNVCFTYFTYCMYTVVGTVESLVVLLPYIILYAHHVAVVYMKYDMKYDTNANLLLQVKCIL